ncbi:lipase/acyltransferase domain-containing protein [Nocardiopsis sp. LOL_012]|uniref:lipase/acyltransferase domain-containing protein n=1 Tax=Nocardiopsis sp. LOL_012 TaxID=3345409 RepID=UPI003A8415A7
MQRAQVNDVVIVVPGILGSRLADKDGKEVWGLSGPALLQGITTFGRSARQLTLPTDIGDDHPGDGVSATGLMQDLHLLPHIGPGVDGYRNLFAWLQREFTLQPATRERPGNLVAFPYDWRLSIRYNARELQRTAQLALEGWRGHHSGNRDAQVVFLCHSMGGLIAHYSLNNLPDPVPTRSVITLGTPFQGSFDALTNLVNGKRLSGLTAVARSLPSLHQLTPAYRCLVQDGERVDAHSVALPGLDPHLMEDAARLHEEMRADNASYTHYAIVGQKQPTAVTGHLEGEKLTASRTIDGDVPAGDGRVARFAARPEGSATPEIGHAEQHGSLQNRRSVRDQIWTCLTAKDKSYRGASRNDLGVAAPDLVTPGTPLTVQASSQDEELRVEATLTPAGQDTDDSTPRPLSNLGNGRYSATFRDLAPGAYRLRVGVRSDRDSAVTHLLLVTDAEAAHA